MRISEGRRRNRGQRTFAAAIVTALAVTIAPVAPVAGQEADPAGEDGIELVVFGPSIVDRLAGEAPDDIQARVQAEVLDGFVAEHPQVASVEWRAQGEVGDSIQNTLAAHLAGEPMDLIACSANPTNGGFASAGILRDITQDIESIRDRFEPDALDVWTFDGKVLGVPASPMVTSTFFYNVDVWDQVGVTPPATTAEFVDVAAKLTEAGYVPVLHRGADTHHWPMWYFEAFAQATEDSVAKTISNLKGETKFTDPADVDAFRAIQKLVEDGILSRDSLGTDVEGMRTAFANERSASYYSGTWELGWALEVPEFEVGVFEFPVIDGMPYPPGHGGGPDLGLCLYEGIDPDHVAAAIDFIEYVSRPEIANIYLEPVSPPASAIKGVNVSAHAIPAELRENHFLRTTRFLDWIWPTRISRAFGTAIEGLVAGELQPEEAAASVQETYDAMVAEGYVFGQ